MIKYPNAPILYDAFIYQLKIILLASNIQPNTTAFVPVQDFPRVSSRITPMIYSCHLCLGRCLNHSVMRLNNLLRTSSLETPRSASFEMCYLGSDHAYSAESAWCREVNSTPLLICMSNSGLNERPRLEY